MSDVPSFWRRHRVRSFREVRGELRWFFAQRGVPAGASDDLILATQEACNNACRYGPDDCDLAVSFFAGTVTIEVADRGQGFDLEAVRALWPPSPLEADGRGLFLIAQLTDQVEVVRRRPGTVVRIFKTIE